jgi:hypothetical protein
MTGEGLKEHWELPLRCAGHQEGKRPLVTTAVAPSTPLSALDRCDRCGAQAYLRVELSGGGELLFCAHHAREHGDKLRQVAVNVHDETEKLSTTPTVAPDGEI